MSKKAGNNDEHLNEDEAKYLELVKTVLVKAQLEPEPISDEPGFRVDFADAEPPLDVFGLAHVLDDYKFFVFHLEFKTRAPKKALPQVERFMTLGNSGLNAGNFELDLKTGRMQFKTYVDYTGTKLTGVFVRNAVLTAIEAVEAFGQALLGVAKGKLTPEDAMKQIDEGGEDE